MSLVLDFILFVVSAVLLAVSGGFVARAAAAVESIDGYSGSTQLQKVHKYLSWSAVTAWVGFALIVVLVVIYVVIGGESIEMTGGIISKGLLLLTLAIAVTTGVLAMIGSIEFKGTGQGGEALRDSVIATITALGGSLVILGIFLYPMFKKKEDEEEDYHDYVEDYEM